MTDDIARDGNGQFAPGNRGGPGRPRSTVSRGAVALDEMGADSGKKLVQVLLDRALEGDMRAADLLLSRIWPTRRGRPVEIVAMPVKTVPDTVTAATDVANAVMRGEITPHEGQALSRVFDTQLQSIDALGRRAPPGGNSKKRTSGENAEATARIRMQSSIAPIGRPYSTVYRTGPMTKKPEFSASDRAGRFAHRIITGKTARLVRAVGRYSRQKQTGETQ